MFEKNRIVEAITKMSAIIADKELGKAQLRALSGNFDATFEEHFKFHEIKSLRFQEGRLNLAEANTIFGILGNYVGHFNGQSLPAKICITKVMQEMFTR